jgi:DUF4097 and DUF4098 domain-containing protein YvlB
MRLLGLVLILATTAAADEWEKKFSVVGKPEVRVESNDAHVQVDTWERKEIEARVITQGWKIGEGGVRIEPGQTGDRISLYVRIPRTQWSLGFDRRSVQIELKVPREANVAVETGDGHVTVRSLTGNLDVHTADGHISVASVRGEIRLRTGDGHVEGEELDGTLEVQTGDGRIRIGGRFDRLDLRTNDGSIEADTKSGSKISTEWSLRTGDGSVRLRLPGDLQADLDALTNDGRITIDLPIAVSGVLGRSAVRGKLNGGGAPLRIKTGDGSIRIDRY